MKVSELAGPLLDYWTGRAARETMMMSNGMAQALRRATATTETYSEYAPSVRWEEGGPLLDQFQVSIGRGQIVEHLMHRDLDDNLNETLIPAARIERKYATARVIHTEAKYQGDTALIAGTRAIVASVYGPEVPDQPPQEA